MTLTGKCTCRFKHPIGEPHKNRSSLSPSSLHLWMFAGGWHCDLVAWPACRAPRVAQQRSAAGNALGQDACEMCLRVVQLWLEFFEGFAWDVRRFTKMTPSEQRILFLKITKWFVLMGVLKVLFSPDFWTVRELKFQSCLLLQGILWDSKQQNSPHRLIVILRHGGKVVITGRIVGWNPTAWYWNQWVFQLRHDITGKILVKIHNVKYALISGEMVWAHQKSTFLNHGTLLGPDSLRPSGIPSKKNHFRRCQNL